MVPIWDTEPIGFAIPFKMAKTPAIKVVDTVGAGDSFLATLISNLLNKVEPGEALSFACAVGALVAGKEGANPKITQSEITNFVKKFNKGYN